MIAGNSVVFSTLVCIIFLCILFIFGKTNTIQKLKLSQAFSYGHVFQVPAESMEPFCLRNQEQWELNVWKWTYYLDVGISYKNQHSLTAEGQNTSKIKFGCCSRIVLLLSSYMTTYPWYHYYALYFCYILTKSISYQMIQAIFWKILLASLYRILLTVSDNKDIERNVIISIFPENSVLIWLCFRFRS